MTMAKLKAGFSPPRSKRLHMQESGAAGFSSDMEHKFTDKYDENVSPVACKGSFVVPIFEKEFDVFGCPGIPLPKADMLAMMHAAKPHPVASVANKVNFSGEVTPVALQGKSHKEEEVNRSIGRTTVRKPRIMVPKGKPLEGTGHPLNVRNGFQTRKRAPRSFWRFFRMFFLLGLIFSFVSGSVAVNCFTCKDKAECQNLYVIYKSENDTTLYAREFAQEIGKCPTSFSPTFEKCTVCKDNGDIRIYCSNDVGGIDVEILNGTEPIIIISCGKEHLRSHGYYGLIPSIGLILIVAALLIYCS
ncbi:uncharacterized protein LOC115045164 isoform X2 [Echeneis naucrates]|uniref:uncharacterized protein LOC115045164 isoform X2 n=1 Tax=Echeneis naucrates TaxID=173247 RepID=UPI00111366CD|nr:uncharacterized protein LOC115045164 isoform X2 [Echeneis naucrates]